MADENEYQSLFPSASPIASMGLDPDEVLASGNPAAYVAAKAAGTTYVPPNARPAPPAPTPVSALAKAANPPPPPAGTSALQPQSSVGRDAAPYFLKNPATEGSGPESLGQRLAQSQVPATNAPNTPGETTGAPSVPASVAPTGDAEDPNQAGIQRAGKMAEGYAERLQDAPTLAQTIQPLEDQRKPPIDPTKYKPSVGQRIVRGLVAAGEGLAQHGIFGALEGGLDPAAVGGTAYGAPTKQFSIAAQKQAAQSANIDRQEKLAQDTYKDDTGRAKDIITSINDIGKNYASGQNAQSRADTAQARKETADVAEQVANIRQQVADFQSQGKTPATYEATVAAAALEKDPDKKAELNQAADTMAKTELKKFQYKAKADGAADNSVFRQSMIDNATEQIKGLQDKYTYNPRRNQYENPNNPNDILNPSEYTDKKNGIAAKLDQQLGQKKMKPLGVRFDPADAGADKPTGRGARQPQPSPSKPATSKPSPPTPSGPAPEGAADMALGSDGQWYYRDAGKKPLGVVK